MGALVRRETSTHDAEGTEFALRAFCSATGSGDPPGLGGVVHARSGRSVTAIPSPRQRLKLLR